MGTGRSLEGFRSCLTPTTARQASCPRAPFTVLDERSDPPRPRLADSAVAAASGGSGDRVSTRRLVPVACVLVLLAGSVSSQPRRAGKVARIGVLAGSDESS